MNTPLEPQAGVNVSFAVEWDVDASVTYQWYHPNATVFTEDAKTLLLKRKMIDRAIDLSEVKEVPPVFVESRKAADVIFPDTRDGDPVSADEAEEEEEEEEEESWKDEPDKEWEVKKILAHGFLQNGGIMYLLEWEDWDEPTVCRSFPPHTSMHINKLHQRISKQWESEDNLCDCQDLVDEYHMANPVPLFGEKAKDPPSCEKHKEPLPLPEAKRKRGSTTRKRTKIDEKVYDVSEVLGVKITQVCGSTTSYSL